MGDPRVEFISQVQIQILIKFHPKNLDQASTSKSQPNISLSINQSINHKLQNLDQTSATNCCQHNPHQQQLQHQQVLSWHLHTPGSHQSSLLNRSELVSQ